MGIKCINCDKFVGFTLDNRQIEYVITTFFTNVVFHDVSLSLIIE